MTEEILFNSWFFNFKTMRASRDTDHFLYQRDDDKNTVDIKIENGSVLWKKLDDKGWRGHFWGAGSGKNEFVAAAYISYIFEKDILEQK